MMHHPSRDPNIQVVGSYALAIGPALVLVSYYVEPHGYGLFKTPIPCAGEPRHAAREANREEWGDMHPNDIGAHLVEVVRRERFVYDSPAAMPPPSPVKRRRKSAPPPPPRMF